ncbi:hypothetical protein [Thiocapsa bogorovii]|nr:hypothetical protein [Thiocapsa bogorovii]
MLLRQVGFTTNRVPVDELGEAATWGFGLRILVLARSAMKI